MAYTVEKNVTESGDRPSTISDALSPFVVGIYEE
jgi:hypothetical protein